MFGRSVLPIIGPYLGREERRSTRLRSRMLRELGTWHCGGQEEGRCRVTLGWLVQSRRPAVDSCCKGCCALQCWHKPGYAWVVTLGYRGRGVLVTLRRRRGRQIGFYYGTYSLQASLKGPVVYGGGVNGASGGSSGVELPG